MIQMKATVPCSTFLAVMFVVLYKVVLTFESVDEILKCGVQIKDIEQYFPVVFFIMLYKVVLSFESVDEILKCDQIKSIEWYLLWCCSYFSFLISSFKRWYSGMITHINYRSLTANMC